jgi:hypothetical protein
VNQAVRAALELAVTAPAGLLCFLALGEHLRIGKARLALLFLLVLGVWVPAGGWLCGRLGWGSNVLLLPSLLVFALILRRLCTLSAWKSISVFLGVCGAFSCLANLSSVVDLWVAPDNLSVWFSLPACLAYNGFCWIFVLAMWYPAVHAVRHLLREMEMPGTWYVFWLLPLVLTLLNVVIQPMGIYGPPAGRNLFFFFVVELMLLCLLLLCYLMFYLMARGLGENLRLQQQNQFLQMQTSQYENLQATIAETRQARHDLRHHFTAIDALLRREEWQELCAYVDAAVASLPDTELNLCENPAVDGVAGHYATLLRREGVPAEYILDLPRLLPADEMDVCVVLSNLLENALEASLCLPPSHRWVRVRGEIHGNAVVLLEVENAYTGEILEDKGGFHSSKRPGHGIGLQSVRRIAAKNGGYCKFQYDGTVFRAQVMLRGEH